MTLRERVENNLVIFFLGVLVVGFLAGITVYEGIIEIANLSVVSKHKITTLNEKINTLTEKKFNLNEQLKTSKKVCEEKVFSLNQKCAIDIKNVKSENLQLSEQVIQLKRQITLLENSAKQLDLEKDKYANVKLDCAVFRYATSVDKNFKCKGRKTIKCGTNEILLNSLHSITCENDSILVTPKGKPEVKCGKQNFEGLIEPRIDELCHTIRSIEFDVTK